jgi:hypothetical protein
MIKKLSLKNYLIQVYNFFLIFILVNKYLDSRINEFNNQFTHFIKSLNSLKNNQFCHNLSEFKEKYHNFIRTQKNSLNELLNSFEEKEKKVQKIICNNNI